MQRVSGTLGTRVETSAGSVGKSSGASSSGGVSQVGTESHAPQASAPKDERSTTAPPPQPITSGHAPSTAPAAAGPSRSAGGVTIPESFTHDTMNRFEKFPPLSALRTAPKESQDGLDDVLDRFGFSEDDAVLFAPQLKTEGVTKPGGDAEVGPLAFADTFKDTFGQPIDLSPEFRNLHVATTAAHELTHRNQYEGLPHIEARIGKGVPLQDRVPIENAMTQQEHVLEALAYHSEVANLNAWRGAQAEPLTPEQHAQFQALVDQASTEAEQHFHALSPRLQEKFLAGDIEGVMRDVIRLLPERLRTSSIVKEPQSD